MRPLLPAVCWLLAVSLAGCAPSNVSGQGESPHRFELEQDDAGLSVLLDGELFTRYQVAPGDKPILWPLVGPGGEEMTRGFPMQEATADETSDHPHHRSVWLGHGEVNGCDFWLEEGPHGRVVHRQFEETTGGETATIVALSDWIAPDDAVLLHERREMVFAAAGNDVRWIDFDIELTAGDEPVTFGDTKEGTFALRVAGWLKVEAEPGGTIENSRGQQNESAWGQPAEWVDYWAERDGEPVGIAIFNHPESFRFPTRWHVRSYGLFGANPVGVHGFGDRDEPSGEFTLEPGESLRLRYRVLLHRGEARSAQIEACWQEYSSTE